MSQIPNTVYRYRSFSALTVSLLCNDDQFFANPKDFNDPFDCSPVIEIDSDLPRLQKILTTLVGDRVQAETLMALSAAKFKEPTALAHADALARREALNALDRVRYYAKDPEYEDPEAAEIDMLQAEIHFELQSRYGKGICCFSEEYDSPLLWSHYADHHRGICVGYSLDRSPIPELKRVQYGGDRTITTSLLERAIVEKQAQAMELLDGKVLLRKAPEWSYEKEWRLIGKLGLQESPMKLTEITFGLRCDGAVRHTLMNALARRQNRVEFYEMRNIQNTFRLTRSPVEFEDTLFFPYTAMSGHEAFGDPDIK